MKKIFFTVGPSEIYPSVPTYLKRGVSEDVMSLSHRGSWFQELYHNTLSDLRRLLSIPQDYKIFFLASATEGMERIIENTVPHKSAHVVTGSFGTKFLEVSGDLRRACSKLEVRPDESLPQSFPFNDPDVICFTQNDTSTGYRIPMDFVYTANEAYPEAFVAVDVVSSIPYVDIDYRRVDMVFFSVQKGFGLPAGLGVLIVSPRAYRRSVKLAKKMSIGSFHSFPNLEKYGDQNQTFETPNVLGIYLFQKVLSDMLKVGIEKIRFETEEKSTLLYDFFEKSGKFIPVVTNSQFQSITTPVVKVEGGSSVIIDELKKKGFVVGSGYGGAKDSQMRVANFPAHRVKDVKRLISEMRALT